MTLDSRLIPYTLTNDPLPNELEPALESFLDDLSQSLGSLDHQIALMMRKRNLVKQQRIQFNALRAPIRRIPPELISSIMRFAIEAVDSGRMTDEERNVLSCLSAVCANWRRVAFATPELWASHDIDLEEWNGDEDETQKAKFVAAMNSMLMHAGPSAPVSLMFSDPNLTWDAANVGISEVLSYLAGCNRNLTSLAFGPGVLTHEGTIGIFKSQSLSVFTRVKYLFLTWWATGVGATPGELHRLDSQFPSLESLLLASYLSQSTHIIFTHHGIRSLSLCCIRSLPSSFSSIIRDLPLLEDLLLYKCYSTSDDEPPHLSPQPASVQRLVIIDEQPDARILGSFTFPSLIFCAIRSQRLTLTKHFIKAFGRAIGDNVRPLTLDLSHVASFAQTPLLTAALICAIRSVPYQLCVSDINVFRDHFCVSTFGNLHISDSPVVEVVCRNATAKPADSLLAWAKKNRIEGRKKVKVYIPRTKAKDQILAQEKALREEGLSVECLPEASIKDMIYRGYPREWSHDPANLENELYLYKG